VGQAPNKNPNFRQGFVVLYVNGVYWIHSNPVYFTKAAGILTPLAVWWFSSNAATILGKAKALPFKVCTN
jgi:hypothetical protein